MKGVSAATDFPMGLTDAVLATVDNAFLIGETEVTYELWYAVRVWAEANGYIFQNDGKEGNDGTAGEAPTVAENEPVTTVSWRDSVVWLNALSEMDGKAPVYRTIADGDENTIIRDSRMLTLP